MCYRPQAEMMTGTGPYLNAASKSRKICNLLRSQKRKVIFPIRHDYNTGIYGYIQGINRVAICPLCSRLAGFPRPRRACHPKTHASSSSFSMLSPLSAYIHPSITTKINISCYAPRLSPPRSIQCQNALIPSPHYRLSWPVSVNF